MPKSDSQKLLRLRGVRQNNLKGFDLELPLRQLIVVTGLSGSGKSSLAFDTLFAEGQRRYVETFSPYARQFFDRMDKPRVDQIEGIPPAIAIEQRNAVRSTRSTVGTMTELCDYTKVLWPQVARLHCRKCGQPVGKDTPAKIREELPAEGELMVTFDLPLAAKLGLGESLELVARQGYQRLWHQGNVLRVEEAEAALAKSTVESLTVIQDRIRLGAGSRARFAEAAEQAYHFGKGRLTVWLKTDSGWDARRYSQHRHCAECNLDYREPVAALFSFNHPLGACPDCRGFGRTIAIDYRRAMPDLRRTLADGVVKPWQSGTGAECQRDLMRFCRSAGIPTNIPFRELAEEQQKLVVDGDPNYGKDDEHEWPRVWYGVKGYFRWLESKAYKMHVRVLLSRYRAYVTCKTCQGARLQPDALDYRLPLADGLTLPRFYALTVREALATVEALRKQHTGSLESALQLAFEEMESRLNYLDQVGLGYLTLDRPTRSLSGGETERVNLATCLGTRLVNTLYVLDEPSVGLHPRDTARLVRVLEQLRNLGNTVVVVEHESAVMRAADQIVDLGPGRGVEGGEVVFQGTLPQLLRSKRSLTGRYLSGAATVGGARQRPVPSPDITSLKVSGVTRHNLRDLVVELPLQRLVCVTGVSGSGKSTLIRDVLHPLLREQLSPGTSVPAGDSLDEDQDESEENDSTPSTALLTGWEKLDDVVLVDQSAIGRTPRSNPAVYVGAFDTIRDLFAASDEAKRRGLAAGGFSFNSQAGQCPRCKGAGFEKIEMQFLSDVFVRCPECDGKRYRPHVLEVAVTPPGADSSQGWNISRFLEATVDEAVEFLARFEERSAARAAAALGWLREVGLGYLQLGQPVNTLSGGECQRLKLVGALAESSAKGKGKAPQCHRLYLLDEPTTGLHFDDVRVLLEALQRLVDLGHSVIVIEHNLDVIRAADWVVDLGPEAGEGGGQLVFEGTPEGLEGNEASHTAAALRGEIGARPKGLSRPRKPKA
ncbi:MAG: hypothetical protein RI897_2075 [Verrucomicrobiota bacterium]